MIGYFNPYSKTLTADQKKIQKYVGTGVTFLWAVLLIVIGLVPTITSALDSMKKIDTATEIDAKLKANLQKIELARRNLQEQAENEVLVTSAIPVEPKLVTLVNEFDLAVAVNSLVMEGFDYVEAKKTVTNAATGGTNVVKPVYSQYGTEFTAKIRGTYPQLRAFIERLESMPRIITLEDLSIAYLDDKELASIDGEEGTNAAVNSPIRLTIRGMFYSKS
jgi:Tfp pilus assembly protein PilO